MPKGFRDMKKELERNTTRKATPELKKMHEVFGDQNADCGMAAQYEGGTCSRIAYDPAKMSFTKRMELQSTSEQPPTELTQFEKDCTRVMKFTQLLKRR